MTFRAIVLLALGLAMDATAVSAARGLAVARVTPRHALLVAVFFGGSQALMPAIGWGLGARVGPFVESFAHWIAFVLLVGIGAKMLYEARGVPSEEAASAAPSAAHGAGDPFAIRTMAALALATSIDALAAGVTLPMLHAPFARSIVTIGVVTAALSVAGLALGRRLGRALGRRLDVVGGLALVVLGVKIVLERLGSR